MKSHEMKHLRAIALAALGASALLAWGAVQAASPARAPYPVDVFVRGSFNDWGLTHAMKFDGKENVYVGYVQLAPGVYEFKIASKDWFEVDLGWYDDPADPLDTPEVTLGVPQQIARVTFSNLLLPIVEQGVYSFKFDASNPDNLTVLVEYARPGGDGSSNGAVTYTQNIYDASWTFGCLGSANPVLGEMHVKGSYLFKPRADGGFHFIDNWSVKGVAFDQSGVEYRFSNTYPVVENLAAGGAYHLTWMYKGVWVSQGGTPNLYMKVVQKVTINANGEVVRDFNFYEDGCSR